MRPQRSAFETTAATRRTAKRAPREALVLFYTRFEKCGAVANDHALFQSAANDNRTTAKRRSVSAAPFVVGSCRVAWLRSTESFVSALLRVKVWMPTNASPAFKFASTRTYTYDAADRLKTVTQGGTTTTFAYDGLGRRLKQTVGATETRYLWCGAAICQQRSNTDVVQKRFFAEGEYVLTGTKKYLYLTDHLGSVRDLIDITGTPTLVGSFDYTPYGAVARSWGTVTPGYTYAGLFAHPSTGLLLSATRAYEPTKGRWLNKDPIRESGGINLYGYVGASPTMLIDPMGLDPVRDTLGFVPVIGAGLDAYDAFKCGNIGLGALHTALALVDMTGIGALGKGLLVGGFKMAALPLLREVYAEGTSMAWGSIRKRMLRRDLLTPGVPTHHWFFHQADYWPDWLINHPANLMPDIGQFAHDLAHRGGVLDGLIYGTPGWAKLAGIGTLSNFIGGVVGGLTNHGGTGCGCK